MVGACTVTIFFEGAKDRRNPCVNSLNSSELCKKNPGNLGTKYQRNVSVSVGSMARKCLGGIRRHFNEVMYTFLPFYSDAEIPILNYPSF